MKHYHGVFLTFVVSTPTPLGYFFLTMMHEVVMLQNIVCYSNVIPSSDLFFKDVNAKFRFSVLYKLTMSPIDDGLWKEYSFALVKYKYM
jgi:hypothetical protein